MFNDSMDIWSLVGKLTKFIVHVYNSTVEPRVFGGEQVADEDLHLRESTGYGLTFCVQRNDEVGGVLSIGTVDIIYTNMDYKVSMWVIDFVRFRNVLYATSLDPYPREPGPKTTFRRAKFEVLCV